MSFQRMRFCGVLLVFSLLLVCFTVSIDSGLVGAVGSASVGWSNQGTVRYLQVNGSRLRFSTDFENAYITNQHGSTPRIWVTNSVTGTLVDIYCYLQGASGTYNFPWVETLNPIETWEETRGITTHSGTKCIGVQTNTGLRTEPTLAGSYINQFGLNNQFYFSGWFYIKPDFVMPFSWWGIFQPYQNSGSGEFFQDLCLTSQSGDNFQFELAVVDGSLSSNHAHIRSGYFTITRGQWHHLEVFQKMSANPDNTRHWCAIDGVQIWDSNPMGHRTTGVEGSQYNIEVMKNYHSSSSSLIEMWWDNLEFWDGIP